MTRLDAVERLRRQLEQLESGGRSGGEFAESVRPHRRSRRGSPSGAGEQTAPSGVWRSDDGPIGDTEFDVRGTAPSPAGPEARRTTGGHVGAGRDRVQSGGENRSGRTDPGDRPARGFRTARTSSRRSGDDSLESIDRPEKVDSPERGDSHTAPADSGAGRRAGRRGSRRRASGSEPEPQAGTEAQAKDVCLRLLTDRAHSRAELADSLAAKGFAPEVAEQTLDRLVSVGLVDDAAFAEQWVHSRHTFSGKGKKVLAQELRRKGVAPEDVEPALESITTEDERVRAAELVRRKLRTLPADLDRDKATRRLVGMLARRGYDPATAYAVVTAELATAAFPDPPRSERSGLHQRRPEPPPRPDPGDAPEAETADTEGDADDPAIDLIRRKLRTMSPALDRDKKIRRLVGMLARRGYNQSQAYTIVKAELEAAAGE